MEEGVLGLTHAINANGGSSNGRIIMLEGNNAGLGRDPYLQLPALCDDCSDTRTTVNSSSRCHSDLCDLCDPSVADVAEIDMHGLNPQMPSRCVD
jgi:hypothetical protein